MVIKCGNIMIMAKFKYTQLGDSAWHSVTGVGKDGNVEYAIFSLVDAPFCKPAAACKHMELHIRENISLEIIEKGNFGFLLNIYRFVFSTVLEITHELKGVKLCKIYSDDALTKMVYKKFADGLGDNYTVKSYRNWIEIRKITKK